MYMYNFIVHVHNTLFFSWYSTCTKKSLVLIRTEWNQVHYDQLMQERVCELIVHVLYMYMYNTCTCTLYMKLLANEINGKMYMYMQLSWQSICLEYRVSWIRIPPEATLIFIFPLSQVSFFLSFFLSTSPITSYISSRCH